MFDNSLAGAAGSEFSDLRGGRPLLPDHAIDWAYFLDSVRSMKIDTKLAYVSFDLPESAIPDNVKSIGNLAQRNLIRSNQVGLCSAERLADFYGIAPLDWKEIEEDRPDLFRLQTPRSTVRGHNFQTPLWYYVLREAAVLGNGITLGPLGSRLIGAVIVGAIYYNPDKLIKSGEWNNEVSCCPRQLEIASRDCKASNFAKGAGVVCRRT